MKSQKKITRKLKQCIKKSIRHSEFQWDVFFKLWFYDNGTPLFFLFNKNLGVTNTQYVELFNLIKTHQKNKYSTEDSKLLFYNISQVKYSFTEIMHSMLEGDSSKNEDLLNLFVNTYVDIFSNSIAVNMFYSSCAVYLPYGIEVNLDTIVFESGYVHSAGYSVHINTIRKTKKNEFISNIRNFLKKVNQSVEIPFIIYSHDDFDKDDKDLFELLDKGPEQCKLFLEKMSIGPFRLSTVIDECKTQLNEYKVVIPDPCLNSKHLFKSNNSLWLISDKSINETNLKSPGNIRYYIVYYQTIKNSSPLYIFDENKPAWKSHTTLPHSLTASLLNIARPLKENAIICDPFSGTGTTWLEIVRASINYNSVSSDLSDATVLLHKDNAFFFSLGCAELKEINVFFSEILNSKSEEQEKIFGFGYYTILKDVYQLLAELRVAQPYEEFEYELTEDMVQKLNKLCFNQRISFYLLLRAELRNKVGFMRKTVTFSDAFKQSLEQIIKQTSSLINLREYIETHIHNNPIPDCNQFIKFPSTYSYSLFPNIFFDKYSTLEQKIISEVIPSKNALDIKPDSYDLIICDPPYGFNTQEDIINLTNLYSNFIETAIMALKRNGQLIICLPGESYTGKPLPYCTRSDLVSRQIILTAIKCKRKVYKQVESLPLTTLHAPYYWEADKALRRTILHFHLE